MLSVVAMKALLYYPSNFPYSGVPTLGPRGPKQASISVSFLSQTLTSPYLPKKRMPCKAIISKTEKQNVILKYMFRVKFIA